MSEQLLAGLNVSRETVVRLEAYADLLRKWTRAINLISAKTADSLWERHIMDSAQLFLLLPPGARTWLDLGSGGGLPGLVVAIIAHEKAPDLHVTLVESDARKAAFLRTAAKGAGVDVGIEVARAESLSPMAADVVSARALAPLPDLLGLAERHLAPGGRAILPKGRNYANEIAAALETWRFSVQKYPSRTDPDSVILSIEGLSRV
ncbi:16S rRNA (guanine(527)-N(7))-methyltransferase RsmG [Alkalilacustris brevis]|uniref:16S rRNA (guanine(527)-N(7))-methyltransferase RsmG n=1 Tax=Alkalilacustris brevis TaxID=2026338 RepID=UPI000E0DBB33|nr:16S rRNA (guanine(527)-N(7))-methyltransferase RsmG [Alkalilacustris brevis]